MPFSLVAFSALSLIFLSLITRSLSMFLIGFMLPGTVCFLILADCSLFHIRNVFSYYLFKYFLRSFLSLFFWYPYNARVAALNVVPEVSWVVFIFFILFSIFCSVAVISTILSPVSLIRFSACYFAVDSF